MQHKIQSNKSFYVNDCKSVLVFFLYHNVVFFNFSDDMTILFSGQKMLYRTKKNTDIIKIFESDGIVITIEYTKISSLTA